MTGQEARDDEREELDYAIRVPLSDLRIEYRPFWRLVRAVQDSVWDAGFRKPALDHKSKALVERAREVSGALEEYEFEGAAGEAAGLLNSLADALARKHPEPEITDETGWEYAIQSESGHLVSLGAPWMDREFALSVTANESGNYGVQRRKAGPWVPVGEGEQTG